MMGILSLTLVAATKKGAFEQLPVWLHFLRTSKTHHAMRGALVAPSFTAAVDAYKRDLETDSSLNPQSRQYRLWCLHKIQLTWPDLWDLRGERQLGFSSGGV